MQNLLNRTVSKHLGPQPEKNNLGESKNSSEAKCVPCCHARLPSQRADSGVAMAAIKPAASSAGKEPQVAGRKSWLGEGQYHF